MIFISSRIYFDFWDFFPHAVEEETRKWLKVHLLCQYTYCVTKSANEAFLVTLRSGFPIYYLFFRKHMDDRNQSRISVNGCAGSLSFHPLVTGEVGYTWREKNCGSFAWEEEEEKAARRKNGFPGWDPSEGWNLRDLNSHMPSAVPAEKERKGVLRPSPFSVLFDPILFADKKRPSGVEPSCSDLPTLPLKQIKKIIEIFFSGVLFPYKNKQQPPFCSLTFRNYNKKIVTLCFNKKKPRACETLQMLTAKRFDWITSRPEAFHFIALTVAFYYK